MLDAIENQTAYLPGVHGEGGRVSDLGPLFDADPWVRVKRCDYRARLLADNHYSRLTPGAREFMSNGRTLVLLSRDGMSTWGAIENRVPNGPEVRWRVSMFRREGGAMRASDLIRAATTRTYAWWRARYGALPPVPLTTEVDPSKTRPKRDPGRCFLRAGWTRTHVHRGLVVLRAPLEAA